MKLPRHGRACIVFVFLSLLTIASAGETLTVTAPPSLAGSAVRLVGSMSLVIALFLGGIWLYRNWQRLSTRSRGRAARLQVQEVRSLGSRQAIYVVAFEQQRFLLASSPQGVSLLSHLPPGEPETEAVHAPAAGLAKVPFNFMEVLRQTMQRKA